MKSILNIILSFLRIKKPAEEPTLVQDTLMLFYRLNFESIEFNLLTKMRIVFETIYPNIETYIDSLVSLNRSLKQGDNVKRTDVGTEYIKMNLEVFLLSKEHYYLDEDEFLERFKRLSIEFLETIDSLEKSNQLNDFNKRMTSIVVTNLNTIASSIQSTVSMIKE